MKMLKNLLLGTALSGLSTLALAAGNPLSVHVLNLQDGLPSPGVEVSLEKLDGERWSKLNEGMTNEQGRITALYPEGKKLESGTYRVTFETGEWFKQHATPEEIAAKYPATRRLPKPGDFEAAEHRRMNRKLDGEVEDKAD